MIAVPRDSVLDVVDDCAAAGVKGLIVISAGFAEADAHGRTLQAELVERVRGYGMRMVGPNCMGVINSDPAIRLNASFAELLPTQGHIALASQSGGLGLAVLALASTKHLGLSTFFSLGNKADVSGNDLLQHAEHDSATSVILLYLESFGNPRRFGQLARRVSRSKPIVVVKSGRTPAGLRAAASHTAGLAASELVVDGLFHQAGVIRADTIDEMFELAACLDAQPLPSGRGVAILTNAGGPGILAADACSAAGLDVLPKVAGMTNPIDLIASADATAYREGIERLLKAEEVNAVIAIYTTIDSRRTEGILSAIKDGVLAGRRHGATRKPVLDLHDGDAGHAAALGGRRDNSGLRLSRTGGPRVGQDCRVRSVAEHRSGRLCIVRGPANQAGAESLPAGGTGARGNLVDRHRAAPAAAGRRSSTGPGRSISLRRRRGGSCARVRLPCGRKARIGQSGAQD